ncbi:alcohol dehydrogenase [Lophiostoma macrostomum CBS 122681]|uniref:Alcohol dehydrogenase n=1 Tax=Lophiostoma macrostomum CBS 122681 TaxID=1314788 RepID=A0A6A6SRT1_9PLEO|nr:alcohol dehydrogenase [Lophiostoma macrostomum CBS 122681]
MAAPTLPKTHQALVQATYASPFELQTVPTPEVRHGDAIIKIIVSGVVSYAKQVYDGTRKYPYPTPIVPGTSAIGRVAALGPDSTALSIGQLVLVDGVIRSRDDPSDIFLHGLHEGGRPGSRKLIREVWRDGTWAEYCSVPLEAVFALNESRLISEMGYSMADLATLARYVVPFGGLKDINVSAGETVIVAPATGAFGGGAVQVAVAMGARVIAMGRQESKLMDLKTHFGEKVEVVRITGDVDKDTEQLLKSSRSPIDAYFDVSPPEAIKSTHIKSCIQAVRVKGMVALMGGLHADVPTPLGVIMRKNLTVKGAWMYEREHVIAFLKMLEAGNVRVGELGGLRKVGEFEFAEWNKALDLASERNEWNSFVVIRPSND